MSIERPTGKLHQFERQFTEPWTTRWFKLTGVHPQLVGGKRATTSVSSRLSMKLKTKRAANNPNPENMRPALSPKRPRVMIPDKQERFNGMIL